MMFVFPVTPEPERGMSNGATDVRPTLPPIIPTGSETVAATYNIDSGVPIRIPLPVTTSTELAIDPYLLALSAAGRASGPVHLPTPRQSVTPAPTGNISANERPKARPKGAAAIAQIHNLRSSARLAAETEPAATSAPALSTSGRKRAMTADKLAAAEAQQMLSSSGKRQRRTAAKVLAPHT